MRDLLEALNAALEQNRDCVYCAVVETRGSTPQKAGAAMLVFPDGSQCGTLGGGCVEAEVRQRALRSLAAGRGEIHSFCLDDDYGWDDGLICGGRMTILADPLSASRPQARDYYRRYRQFVADGAGCTEAIELSSGRRFLFDAANRLVGRIGDIESANGGLVDEIQRRLPPLENRPRPSVQHGVAFLPILPRVTLLIVGGGHVGLAVAKLAAEVDFDIWVLDDRDRYASRERFPMAQRLLVGDIGSTLKELARDLTPSTYCLIVTRGHAHDEEALYHLAQTPAKYVGMIGSQRKKKLIYDDLLAKGVPETALARVHSPLGFAIGSQTVPEIAVSIVAELIACRNLGHTIPEARVRTKT